MLQTVGEHLQDERLDPGARFLLIGPAGHYTVQIGNLGDPAAILLALELDAQHVETSLLSPRQSGVARP